MKLFGRTISITHNNDVSTISYSSSESEIVLPLPVHEDFSDHSSHSFSSPLEVNSPMEHVAKRIKIPVRKVLTSVQDNDEASQQTTFSGLIENPKTPTSETETSQLNSTKNGEQSDISQDQSPSKPDKIVPCPRCNNMDTKFCYYNNHNVKQPRHFCKNCQRYWTAGGIMRNMLVGAGRRKNKISPQLSSAVSCYHQVIVPDNQQSTVLNFGSDSSTMSATSLNKKMNVGSHEENVDKSCQTFHPHTQFPFQGYSTFSTPWPYPWNPSMPYPISFYPNIAYWGGYLPPSLSVQSISTQSCEPCLPTLGKHSRDGNILIHSNSEKENVCLESNNGVLTPKTLRFDDPNEAAKSSIWSTLGIKNGGGFFEAFASKGDDKNHVIEASSSVLQANPAALSRSLLFHERI